MKELCRTALQLASAIPSMQSIDLQDFSLYLVLVGKEEQRLGVPPSRGTLPVGNTFLSPWPCLTTRRVVGNVGFHWILCHPLNWVLMDSLLLSEDG